MRFNGGGYDQVGLAFLSHFIDKEYDVFKKKRRLDDGFAGEQTVTIEPSQNSYLKKVYILTSVYTVSAAETAILATLNFPNFEIVGSHTNGALSDVLVKELPNGWEYWISNEVYESTSGVVYEVTGIPPNHTIEYPRDEDEFFKSIHNELKTNDRAIEKVLELKD
jgi:C-terminal processing protease CtpA/Prc